MDQKPTGPKNTEGTAREGKADDLPFGAADEKRRADQNATNTAWLIRKVDAAHALLCPGEAGTWQQRAEQLVAAAGRIAGTWHNGLSPGDYRKLAAWFADPKRKPALTAFTAGAARDAASAFEAANRR